MVSNYNSWVNRDIKQKINYYGLLQCRQVIENTFWIYFFLVHAGKCLETSILQKYAFCIMLKAEISQAWTWQPQ